ncbi:MAG: hypothetical protein ACI9PY_002877 [Ascidiaceihabitans sp.]
MNDKFSGGQTMRIIALATFAIFLHAGSVFAWGANGHRITAKIGEDNLTSVAAERLKDIVGDQSLALMATWPDFVRSFPEYDCFKPWHFLTVDDGTSIDDARSVRPNRSGSCDRTALMRWACRQMWSMRSPIFLTFWTAMHKRPRILPRC